VAFHDVNTCLNEDLAQACEQVSYLLCRIDPEQYARALGQPGWSWMTDTVPRGSFRGFQRSGPPILVQAPPPPLVPSVVASSEPEEGGNGGDSTRDVEPPQTEGSVIDLRSPTPGTLLLSLS
jgi:hypothetical protein